MGFSAHIPWPRRPRSPRLPQRLQRLGLLLVLSAVVACEDPGTTTIAFVGLSESPCDEDGLVLFGHVPVRMVGEGAATLKQVSVTFGEGSDPIKVEGPPFDLILDTTSRSVEGNVRLTAVGTDTEGRVSGGSIVVCVDNEPPNLTVKEPHAGSLITVEDSELVVRYSAPDGLGLERLTATLSLPGAHQQIECPLPDGPKEAQCTLSPVELGAYLEPGTTADGLLTVNARDNAGNEKAEEISLKVATHLRWSVPLKPITQAAAPVADGRVAVGTESRDILILKDGELVCQCLLPDPAIVGNPREIMAGLVASEAGTRVYVSTYENLWSVDITTCDNGPSCTVEWNSGTGERMDGYFSSPSMALLESQGLLFVGRTGATATPGTLEAYSTANGTLRGAFEITGLAGEPVVKGMPVLAPDNQTLYMGSPEDKLLAIDITPLFEGQNGTMVQRWAFEADDKVQTPPLVTGERVYLAGGSTSLYALDPVQGTLDGGFSTFEAEKSIVSGIAQSLDGQLLYFAASDANVYAVNASGQKVGQAEVDVVGQGGQLVVDQGGRVYVATERNPDGRVYCLSQNLDQVLWHFQPPQASRFEASPVLVDGVLYIGNHNGYLYALDSDL